MNKGSGCLNQKVASPLSEGFREESLAGHQHCCPVVPMSLPSMTYEPGSAGKAGRRGLLLQGGHTLSRSRAGGGAVTWAVQVGQGWGTDQHPWGAARTWREA